MTRDRRWEEVDAETWDNDPFNYNWIESLDRPSESTYLMKICAHIFHVFSNIFPPIHAKPHAHLHAHAPPALFEFKFVPLLVSKFREDVQAPWKEWGIKKHTFV